MKIAHVIQPGPVAGAERVVLGGCAALAAAGAEVTLIVLAEERAREAQTPFIAAARALPVEVVSLPVRDRLGLEVPGALRDVLAARGVEVLHAHGAKALALAAAAAPTRLVCTLHGETSRTWRERGYEALQRALARRADCVFTVTPAALPGARRCAYVPNPLTREVAAPAAPRALGADAPLDLLTVGRLSPEKGLDVLIDALALLEPGVARLTVAGDGPERDALVARARDRGVPVDMLGFVEDLSGPLARAHAFALPSHTEGMPLALIEARAAGLPVVASDVGAVGSMVDHGVDGELVGAGDPAALATAIRRLRRGYADASRAALERATRERDSRSTARWAERTMAVYEDLVGQPATFIVFGDDWGAHPSTTQHLMRHMRPDDRVVWIDSIGMRAPRLDRADLERVASKLGALTRGRPRRASEATGAGEPGAPDAIVRPVVSPWHRRSRTLNRALLGAQVSRALASLPPSSGPRVLLTTNPIAELYADAIPHDRLVYLKLDDYPNLPGVDARMVLPSERALMTRADAVLTTARSIAPTRRASTLLPQGVDWAHFASREHAPAPGAPVLGFFGLFAEWLDDGLILELARARPDWVLEFVGPSRRDTARFEAVANIRMAPAVPYAELPARTAGWSAAWIPFARGPLTDGVDPLKLREYLAGGLPTACTGLPEVAARADALGVQIIDDAADASRWLDAVAALESDLSRRARRERVRPESWTERARTLRRVALGDLDLTSELAS
jgi:glycosyltransferase involved in cell wall biosynthesis